MTGRLVAVGVLALTAGIAGGWKLGRTSGLHDSMIALVSRDQAIDRLKQELAAETRERLRQQDAADYCAKVVAAQRGHIDWLEQRVDRLEHEQAIDGGNWLTAEDERWLERGGS